MRIAIVAEQTIQHSESDASDRITRLAELLAERGHEVTIFCAQWWEGTITEFEKADVQYHAITTNASGARGRFAFRLFSTLRSFEPEIIHLAYPSFGVLGSAKLVGSLLQVPLIVEWYDHDRLRKRGRFLSRMAFRLPHTIITPSRLVETNIRELGRDMEIDVIPNSIDMNAVRSIKPDKDVDVVFSGPLDAYANLGHLLLALAEFRERDWNAVIIGDGSHRDRYEVEAMDLRIDDRVEFTGDLSITERIKYFKSAHVVVHTALKTPFATDFLRALACGCIGIAEYNVDSSAHELIEHYERGIRTTTDDDIVKALRTAADMPYQEVDEEFARFDEQHVLDQYLACYRELLAV